MPRVSEVVDMEGRQQVETQQDGQCPSKVWAPSPSTRATAR
jgi:hypothetical protein